jgi:hypothetical protein
MEGPQNPFRGLGLGLQVFAPFAREIPALGARGKTRKIWQEPNFIQQQTRILFQNMF